MSDKTWFVIENIVCVVCATLLALYLDGWWKLLCILPLTMVNIWSRK